MQFDRPRCLWSRSRLVRPCDYSRFPSCGGGCGVEESSHSSPRECAAATASSLPSSRASPSWITGRRRFGSIYQRGPSQSKMHPPTVRHTGISPLTQLPHYRAGNRLKIRDPSIFQSRFRGSLPLFYWTYDFCRHSQRPPSAEFAVGCHLLDQSLDGVADSPAAGIAAGLPLVPGGQGGPRLPTFGVGRGFAIWGPFPVQAPDRAPETCTSVNKNLALHPALPVVAGWGGFALLLPTATWASTTTARHLCA